MVGLFRSRNTEDEKLVQFIRNTNSCNRTLYILDARSPEGLTQLIVTLVSQHISHSKILVIKALVITRCKVGAMQQLDADDDK